MSLETAEAAIDFIERIAPAKGKLCITFHGGEPLLAPAEWYKFMLPRLKERFGCRLRLFMQTNLLDLSDEMLEMIWRYNIRIGSSVDGYETMCDAQRGGGYYRRNLSSRKRLEGKGISAGCICTFTPAFITREAIEKAFLDFSFPFSIHGSVPSLGCCPEKNTVSINEMQKLLLTGYEVYKDNISENRITTIDSMAKGCFEGKGSLCTFYDCLGTFAAISSEGGVYSCQRFCGHTEYCFGQVSDGLTEEDILRSPAYKKLFERQTAQDAACGNCPHIDYCRGGCLYNRVVSGTEHDPYCEAYKAVFNRIANDMALEMAGLMTGRMKPEEVRVLAMAGDQPHPYDARINRK